MKPLGALLLLLAAGLGAAEAGRWPLGPAEARLLQAGYVQDPRSAGWDAELELRFVNPDPRRRFKRDVLVQFKDAQGRKAVWKGFVSLAPGSAQHRRVRAPKRLRCAGPLDACPEMQVQVGSEKAAALAVPKALLHEPEAPPAGQPLWVAKVFDGDTLELTDGRKVRLLGIDCPERERRDGLKGPEPYYREAAELTRARVLAGPVTLAYDGERRDVYGRWLAQVSLQDGSDLNAELLRAGLARVYERSEAGRLEAYKKIEAQAREKGLGLWKAP